MSASALGDGLRMLGLFVLAGAAEIVGGWLIWQWLRLERPWPLGMVGGVLLVGYSVLATLQQEPHFGRVYAAYGGIFIVMALLWARTVDGFRPDRWDIIGAALCLVGVGVMMLIPRT